uniref:Centrosomal protein of 78 kDa n=1 Tax=Trichobilharzia regenti TaxID=157069 RepID=A0AA85J7L3_TRIRE|nr:unnamed protein product [Trichobilharzia regenti]
MIPTVKERQAGSYDFRKYYENLCALHNCSPLTTVTCHVGEGVLDISADRVRVSDWEPLLAALKINRNLRFIAIRSFYQHANLSDNVYSRYRRRPPALLSSSRLLLNLCKCLRQCMRVTENLTFLELQNLPMSRASLLQICEGIERNRTLKHLSFEGSSVNDEGLADICRVLRCAPNISTLNLTACNVTKFGIPSLTMLINFQAMQRHNAAWQESLRYRFPELDRLGGLKRITMNDNPGIGDEGSVLLADALIDDLWVKAIDLQACNLGDTAASTWLAVLIGLRVANANKSVVINNETHLQSNVSGLDNQHRGNFSLVVLDLRRNPDISRDLLRAVTERALINSEGKQTEFSWLKAGPQTPSKLCSGVITYPWPGITGMTKLPGSYHSDTGESIQSTDRSGRRSKSKDSIYHERRHNVNDTPMHIQHKDNLSDRPPFIPAGGRLRCNSAGPRYSTDCRIPHKCNLDLTKKSNRYSHSGESGPFSERAVWKPPGIARINNKASCNKPSTPLSARTESGGGIPWRTAARASRCRDYPSHHCPGKTCLESRALHLDYDLVHRYKTTANSNSSKHPMPDPSHSSRKSIIYPSARSLNTTTSDGHRHQSQCHKQNRLNSKQTPNSKLSSSTPNPSSRLSGSITQQKLKQLMVNDHDILKIDSNSVQELRSFIYRLTSLIENLQNSKKNKTNTSNEELHILQDTFEDLCSLVSRITEKNYQCPDEGCPTELTINDNDNDNNHNNNRMEKNFTENYPTTTTTTYFTGIRSSNGGGGGGSHRYRLDSKLKNEQKYQAYVIGSSSRSRSSGSGNNRSCSTKPPPTVKNHIHWKTYAKTRAVQTDSPKQLVTVDESIGVNHANTNTTKITTTTTTPTATPRVVVVSIDNSNNQIGNDVEEDSQLTPTTTLTDNNDNNASLWIMNYDDNNNNNNNNNANGSSDDKNHNDVQLGGQCFNIMKNNNKNNENNNAMTTANHQLMDNFDIYKRSSQTDQFYAELKANTMINRMNESTMHNNKKLSKDEKEEKKDTTQMQNSRSEMKINEIWPVNSTLMMDEKATSSSCLFNIPSIEQNSCQENINSIHDNNISNNKVSFDGKEYNNMYTTERYNQDLNKFNALNIEQNITNKNHELNNTSNSFLNDENFQTNENKNGDYAGNINLNLNNYNDDDDDDKASDDELFDELIMENYCSPIHSSSDNNSDNYNAIVFDNNYSSDTSSLHMNGTNLFYQSTNNSLISTEN